jgi:hypothetical protein
MRLVRRIGWHKAGPGSKRGVCARPLIESATQEEGSVAKEIGWSGFLRFGGAAFCLIALFALGLSGWLGWKDLRRQRAWTPVEGEVVGGQVLEREGRAGTSTRSITFEARFSVRYPVRGEAYEGNVGVGYGTSDRSVMEKMLKRFPKGTTLHLKYNPDDPSQLIFSAEQSDLANMGSRSIFRWGYTLLGIGVVLLLLPSLSRNSVSS